MVEFETLMKLAKMRKTNKKQYDKVMKDLEPVMDDVMKITISATQKNTVQFMKDMKTNMDKAFKEE